MEQFTGHGLKLPMWELLESSNRILLSGCGGGFDFLHSLPLYFSLKAMGKTVFLSNLTFSPLKLTTAQVLVTAQDLAHSPVLFEVNADSEAGGEHTPANYYFPEKYLCEWLRSVAHVEETVYTFMRRGITSLTDAYRYLIGTHAIDLVVLVDGGSDSLMAGDEKGLGTPAEDMMSMFSVQATGCKAMLICLGFGADRYHGVSDCSTLRAVAELTAAGGFLGSFSLMKEMPEVQGYLAASEYIQSRMQTFPSIVNYYIRSSLEGHFGNYNTNPRTAGSRLFINPQMAQYYAFSLPHVIERVKYRDLIEDTKTQMDLVMGLEYYRNNNPIRTEHEDIPRTEDI